MAILSFYVPLPEPLEAAGFVDYSFEQPFHCAVVERSRIDLLDMRQDVCFTGRLIDLDPENPFFCADRQRASRAIVQQADQLFIDLIDALPQFVDPL
jgi:hypothetical protein